MRVRVRTRTPNFVSVWTNKSLIHCNCVMFHENICHPWSQANQGGPTKNPTSQESLFVAGMFRQWGYRDVDYDLESNAGLRVEKEPGARSVISLSDGSKGAAYLWFSNLSSLNHVKSIKHELFELMESFGSNYIKLRNFASSRMAAYIFWLKRRRKRHRRNLSNHLRG